MHYAYRYMYINIYSKVGAPRELWRIADSALSCQKPVMSVSGRSADRRQYTRFMHREPVKSYTARMYIVRPIEARPPLAWPEVLAPAKPPPWLPHVCADVLLAPP